MVVTQPLSRQKLKEYLINLTLCTIAMEACRSAHYWARLLGSYGHQVKLIAPQFVKPFVKSNKSDAADAEAICEAGQRPTKRFVGIKAIEQQDSQSIHRMRSLTVGQRTAQINQIRGLLLAHGIEIPAGRSHQLKRLSEILEDADNSLSDLFRGELFGLYGALKHFNEQMCSKACREIARQQWNFSPSGATVEIEEHRVELPSVEVLELIIDPGSESEAIVASMKSMKISGAGRQWLLVGLRRNSKWVDSQTTD